MRKTRGALGPPHTVWEVSVMYYSNGNYEAFARPLKPAGVDEKSAWLVGAGLASLAAACFWCVTAR